MKLSRVVLYTDETAFNELLKKHKIEHPGIVNTGYNPAWLQKPPQSKGRFDILIKGVNK